jgi:glycolate oxidase iron-sulfur subunit
MQTNLMPSLLDTPLGQEADEILRRCVHCGFCTATCPTYQILGDELDSPRGRIYLIKEMLEGSPVTPTTQVHLDRCLTCRNCETTCPSGVAYGHLIDIGRQMAAQEVKRTVTDRATREVLRTVLGSRWFGPMYRIGQALRGWLPPVLKNKVLARRDPGALPNHTASHARQVLMLNGCVQPGMMPSIDAATIRVLDKLGIGTQVAAGSGCCGAMNFHLDAHEQARSQMRANIDAWWPLLNSGQIEAVVMNASGCGAMVREYGHHLRMDPAYAEKAKLVSDRVMDVAQLLAPMASELSQKLDRTLLPEKTVFHPPCTLQHWQGLRPVSETLLQEVGFDLQPFEETHLCCGSAGTYSVLQPEIATSLRDRKLGHIEKSQPSVIVSSNIGCIGHLQSGTQTPVRHWIEVVDQAMR